MTKYVSNILQSDEQVIHQATIHWIVYVPAAIFLIAGLALLIWVAPIY